MQSALHEVLVNVFMLLVLLVLFRIIIVLSLLYLLVVTPCLHILNNMLDKTPWVIYRNILVLRLLTPDQTLIHTLSILFLISESYLICTYYSKIAVSGQPLRLTITVFAVAFPLLATQLCNTLCVLHHLVAVSR